MSPILTYILLFVIIIFLTLIMIKLLNLVWNKSSNGRIAGNLFLLTFVGFMMALFGIILLFVKFSP